MAAEGEEGMVVTTAGSGGSDDEGTSKYPIGVNFVPYDEEIIEFYLLPRLQGRPTLPNVAIIEANVYEFHPETLVYGKFKDGNKDAWFFLSPRGRKYGTRASRKTEDGCGRWKLGVRVEAVTARGTKFSKGSLSYFEGTLKNEQKTKWLMREYTIPEYTIEPSRNSATLDEYVLCKIYASPRHEAIDGEADTVSECEEAQDTQVTPASELSGRKAGKKRTRKGRLATAGLTPASGAGHTPVLAQAQPGGCDGQDPVQQPPRLTQFPLNATTPYLNSNSSDQMVQRADAGFRASETGFRPLVSLTCYYNHKYRDVQLPGNVAYGMPPQQRQMAFEVPPPSSPQRHPSFNGNANDHTGAVAYGWPPYNSNPYEGCSTAHAAQPTRNKGHAPVQQPPIPTPFAPGAYPNSYGQMTTMVRPAGNNLGFPASSTGIIRPEVSLNCYYDQALQPPGNAAYRMPQQGPMTFAPTQDHVYFNNSDHDHAGAVARAWPSDNCNPDQSSSMMVQAAGARGEATTAPNAVAVRGPGFRGCINASLTASGHSEATAPYAGSGIRGGTVCDVRGEWHAEYPADLAHNPSVAGTRPESADVSDLTGPADPFSASENRETSLHKQDTA